MYWFFSILSLLLLAFNLEYVMGRPWHNHYVLIWSWHTFRLLRILPRDVFVLIDGDTIYRYLNDQPHRKDTYIPSIQLDHRIRRDILHYRYLLDWVKKAPVLKAYPPHLKSDVDILNYVAGKIELGE